ncbi:MAG: type III-A CRISPR-associated RAMP protein Csm3 [Phycisphaerae bacterium]
MNAANWKLKRYRIITGQIEVVTGLRIGASQDTMEISGLDNPILRNPASGDPYIPGSSLKGKMRSLMEWYLGKLSADGKPYSTKDPNCPITRVFGGPATQDFQIGPTRLLVRDALLSEESRRTFESGKPITEVKHENSINRLTAMANPRPMERVVPRVKFDLEIVYRVLDTGDGGAADEENFTKIVLTALALVQADCLGSAGSRGCGKVRFQLKDEDGKGIVLPALDATQAKAQ